MLRTKTASAALTAPEAQASAGARSHPSAGARSHSCCGPSSGHRPAPAATTLPPRAGDPRQPAHATVLIPGGSFLMGSDDTEAFLDDGEGPVREVALNVYRIDTVAVSNGRYAEFVRDTGYVTDAERCGWSFVFQAMVSARTRVRDGIVPDAPWWLAVDGASWRSPEGPGSTTDDRGGHPVVHVSWRDAAAYAAWAGKGLPTEAQWEKAARGGLVQVRYPWGDEFRPGGAHRCNTWQGRFPTINTGSDGYVGTAPVDAFEPNGYGLYNMAGNVWEWCADWWSANWHAVAPPGARQDPRGPAAGDAKVMRGGSWLCHASYCNRYRVAARSCSSVDSSTSHIGFRCASAVTPD
ncbi:MAG: formylglycine-generating enzyme family protein [Betaproteobacteria bacterium]